MPEMLGLQFMRNGVVPARVQVVRDPAAYSDCEAFKSPLVTVVKGDVEQQESCLEACKVRRLSVLAQPGN